MNEYQVAHFYGPRRIGLYTMSQKTVHFVSVKTSSNLHNFFFKFWYVDGKVTEIVCYYTFST